MRFSAASPSASLVPPRPAAPAPLPPPASRFAQLARSCGPCRLPTLPFNALPKHLVVPCTLHRYPLTRLAACLGVHMHCPSSCAVDADCPSSMPICNGSPYAAAAARAAGLVKPTAAAVGKSVAASEIQPLKHEDDDEEEDDDEHDEDDDDDEDEDGEWRLTRMKGESGEAVRRRNGREFSSTWLGLSSTLEWLPVRCADYYCGARTRARQGGLGTVSTAMSRRPHIFPALMLLFDWCCR